MNANEIVRALRNTCNGCNPTPCCEFEVLGPEAAELIESLQAQLAEKTKEAEGWHILRLDADRIREGMMQKEMRLIGDNMRLEKQLTASQRREQAAVEDLKDALYDPLTIDCGYCKYRGAETNEHVATTGGCHACENHGGFYDCFEWRGPQESEAKP